MKLAGKVAVVTGGAVRLGQAISRSLADAGASVCVHYCTSKGPATETVQQICAAGGRAVAVQADLRQTVKSARTIMQQACHHFGSVDLLVNNAAIFEAGTLQTTSDEAFDRHVAINLKAPLFLAQAFVEQLGQQQHGHILNVADWRGTRPRPGHLAYTLTKNGIVALTRLLAQELAPQVQVNAVAPGAILLPAGASDTDEEQLKSKVPLRKMGNPGDIADAVLYLLRSDFVTGEVIHVTGGEHL